MEVTAVIKALEHIHNNPQQVTQITIITDSQYVTGLPLRAKKLMHNNFITRGGNELQNTTLIKQLFDLMLLYNVELVKVKAHQYGNDQLGYNRKVDMFSRQLVREAVKKRK